MGEPTEKVDEGVRIAVPEFVADKDDPFAFDLLGREPRVRMLCDFVRSVSDHAVIAVDGGWGTGKTAFLRLCKAYLEQHEVRVAEFNAWTESYTADPLFNLASALADVVAEESRGKFTQTLRAVSLAAARQLPFGVGEMAAAGAEALGEDEGFPNGLPEYRDRVREFRKELEEIAGRETSPLVVLVDELDRSLPEQVVGYLEAVHNLLAVDGVVVVVALNSDETANGLKAVYGEEYGTHRYLQRFFDLRLALNDPRDGDAARFLGQLWIDLGLEAGYRSDVGNALLKAMVLAPGNVLRDMQRAVQALRQATLGVGEPSLKDSVPDGPGMRFHAVLALVFLRQIDPVGYRQFLGGERNVREVMLALHGQLALDTPEWVMAARDLAAYLDVFGDQVGSTSMDEDAYREVAELYGFDALRLGYEGFENVRGRAFVNLRPEITRLLAAVEMAGEWPDRYQEGRVMVRSD